MAANDRTRYHEGFTVQNHCQLPHGVLGVAETRLEGPCFARGRRPYKRPNHPTPVCRQPEKAAKPVTFFTPVQEEKGG